MGPTIWVRRDLQSPLFSPVFSHAQDSTGLCSVASRVRSASLFSSYLLRLRTSAGLGGVDSSEEHFPQGHGVVPRLETQLLV